MREPRRGASNRGTLCTACEKNPPMEGLRQCEFCLRQQREHNAAGREREGGPSRYLTDAEENHVPRIFGFDPKRGGVTAKRRAALRKLERGSV